MKKDDTIQLVESYRNDNNYLRQYREGLRCLLETKNLSVMEAEILFSLYLDENCDNITNICMDIGKTKGVVSKACEHLCREKYISDEIDAIDRRIIHFSLEENGVKLVRSLSRYMKAMEYVRAARNNAEHDDCLVLSGRLHTESGMFFPIRISSFGARSFYLRPYFGYDRFLKDSFVPFLDQSELGKVRDRFILSALRRDLKTETVTEDYLNVATNRGT